MKDLKQITVVGLGLLGGSITLAAVRSFPRVKIVGYTHRPATRRKASRLAVATEIADNLTDAVSNADLVILATPVLTFEQIFWQIADALPAGCIVTDVGSTKAAPVRWAREQLPETVHYVGSHPIAGSEQRGVEFARDDFFFQTVCILTATKNTNRNAVQLLKEFWETLGCSVGIMTPTRHDSIFARVSHLPHLTAAALINANDIETLKFAGKGFMDTSRIASGPPNIWADILATNAKNISEGIDKLIAELVKMKEVLDGPNKRQIQKLLEKAKNKRSQIINYKMRKKELIQ